MSGPRTERSGSDPRGGDRPRPPRTTIVDLRRKKLAGDRIVMVTAYDATMARLAERAGVDVILVGDSLGNVVQGHPDTLRVTLDQMAYHCACVARGTERAHLVGDMPFMTYQVSVDEALRNAARLLQEGGVQSVKLEGGVRSAETVRRLVECGIPVVGHVGLTPQSVHAMGGFRVQGRTADEARRVLDDAVAVAQAGAFCVVLEGIPADLATRITRELTVPTVGIGAGVGCDGQVLVCNDLLGLDLSFSPKFVKRFARLEETVVDAIGAYAREVREGTFPGPEHAFGARAPAAPAEVAEPVPADVPAEPVPRLY